MDALTPWLLPVLIFLPSVGALAVLAARTSKQVRCLTCAAMAAALLLCLLILIPFNWHGVSYSYGPSGVVGLVADVRWIPAFNIHFKVGIDGLSLPLVLLTTFIFLLAAVASWNRETMTKGYFALLLLLETTVLGAILSLDLFLFYVFFEVSLLPIYCLVARWGGLRREYAALKFILYMGAGSMGLLAALIGIHLWTRGLPALPNGTFDLVDLASPQRQAQLAAAGLGVHAAQGLFLALMMGLLVGLPAVPLHTWFLDVIAEAPTPVGMILSAVLIKLSALGLFRIALPLFPAAARSLWLPAALLGAATFIYAALGALGQRDFKRLIAYSAVSHAGLVLLGASLLTPAGVNGALFLMTAEGVTSAMLLFLAGVISRRARHAELSRLGGLAEPMPLCAAFCTFACFAELGLPALCGFVGPFLILVGAFQAARPDTILVTSGFATATQIYALGITTSFGLILIAACLLWSLQRIFFGSARPHYASLPDLDRQEIAVLTPLTVLSLLLGVLPAVFVFSMTSPPVTALLKLLS